MSDHEDEDVTTEALLELINAMDAGIIQARRIISKAKGLKVAVAVREETFTSLKFEEQTGARIGKFGVAYEKSNIPDHWNSAFNILRKNNATIKDRYYGEEYEFTYWLYENKIYRQKRKK
jgi:hypothetical protein